MAQQILPWRNTDGSGAVVPYTPGADPGDWRPTPPAFLPALAPQWPSVTPWAMTSASQFRPPAPPALGSTAYATAFNEVKSLGRADSTTRTADQTQIAFFWRDAAGTPYAFGHWNEIAAGVSVRQGLDLVANARLFALLNLATADAVIDAWDAKFAYNFWRPVTAIAFPGDSTLNPAAASDPTWAPLIVTPNFPSYTSAHSTVSGAAAAVLTALFGPDYPFTAGSDGLPGVMRSFGSFDGAAAEAGQSRIYGGIHYRFDNQAGLASGRALGQYVFRNFLRPSEAGDALRDDRHGEDAAFLAQGLALPLAPSRDAFSGSGRTNPSAAPRAPDFPAVTDQSPGIMSTPEPPAKSAAPRHLVDQLFADPADSTLAFPVDEVIAPP